MTDINRHDSEENDNIDRMSSLPDDVLTHILSFVSTRETVQTCILSKRWINTWASVPDLKFDIKEFVGLPFLHDEMAVAILTKFELLVKSLLEKRETSCVNKFQLWLDSGVYWPRTQAVADCISDVMKLEPRECSIKLRLCKNLNLNMDLIFTCASLIYLQLQLCLSTEFVPLEPNSVNLPFLKTLNLGGVTMSDDSFQKLLLGCPVLDELVLEGCDISIIKICSNTLKKFVLFSYYDVMRLHISTPNLLYLDIHVWGIEEILLLNMPLLVDAVIFIPGWYDQDNYITEGLELIHSLSNVERLRLEFDCPKGKGLRKDFSDDPPVFNNLKCLTLGNWGLHDFDLTLFFLHHSPTLHELSLLN